MIDLNTFLPPTSSLQQLTDGYNINDRGEIFGLGLARARPGCADEFACGHVFVLIPCDDDHSDEEGCENAPEGINAASRKSPPPVNQSAISVTEGSMTPEMLTKLRDRFARRYRGFGIWPRR